MNRVAQRLLRAVLGKDRLDGLLGGLDFIFHRQSITGFGGPMNGSVTRLIAFNELKRRCSFDAIIETGTYRGESTLFFAMAACPAPVYSSEVNARYLGYARFRLWRRPNVRFCLGDSREFLRRLIQDPGVPKDRVFFYLDAHWHDDLPLREEVDLIFRHWARPVVMVDDFQVPDDPGYQFDDYGEDKKLSLEYLTSISHLGFMPFFPVLPSSLETGLKRGWVVLASDDLSVAQLRAMPQFREWQPSDAYR